MVNQVPLSELNLRMKNFKENMNRLSPNWEIAVIFSKINQYYFTGTMQDGMLIIPRDDKPTYWVRRSFKRAADESLFPDINKMGSYKDAKGCVKNLSDTVYLETEIVPLALLKRFQKHFPFENIEPLDLQIAATRAIKSTYEMDLIEQAGKIHKRVLEDRMPAVFKEGMSEAELATELYSILVQEGHHGIARFGMFDTELRLGHIGFGASSIYPTYFNGPGGNYGLSPAAPILGSRETKLKTGDLIFIDIGCGYNGYHTDKTMTYVFGKSLPDEAIAIHNKCLDIQNQIADKLRPGNIPADIYNSVMDSLDSNFLKNFMGFGNRTVKFLGHGTGLVIDELPVIANKFTRPLKEGMVFAVEPKKGVEGIGMVGVENTFKVTKDGGICITGDNPGLIPV